MSFDISLHAMVMRLARSSDSSDVMSAGVMVLIPAAACARPSSVAAIRWMMVEYSARSIAWTRDFFGDVVSSPRSLVARPRSVSLLSSWWIISWALVASPGSSDSLACHMRRALW